MPTITIRLSKDEKADLESAARRSDSTLSDYVRETLALRRNEDAIDGLNARVEELWRRVERLEGMAGADV
jgi:uncharacterized protein (DUF1778 family)